MKKYNINVNFISKKIYPEIIDLVQNDYNSTHLKFKFDVEATTYLFKLKFPDDTEWVKDIKNNEITLEKGVLSQKGIYQYEISSYDENKRLTANAIGKLKVREELISTDEIIEVDDRVPVLDTLINEVDAINIDVKKVDNVATVTLIDKNGVKKEVEIYDGTSGESGTTNYNVLSNKPKINGVELIGNKTSQELGLESYDDTDLRNQINTINEDLGNTQTKIQELENDIDGLEDNIPTKTSQLQNDSNFISQEQDPTVPSYVKNISQQDINNWNNKSTFSGNYNDLSNKPSIPSKTSDLTNDNNFINQIPSEYKTKAENDLLYQEKGNYIKTDNFPIASSNTLGGIKVGANLSIDSDGTLNATGGGEGGTTDYLALSNKPSINGVTLNGNKTSQDLGLQASGDYATKSEIPTNVSQLNNDSSFVNESNVNTIMNNVKSNYVKDGLVNNSNELSDEEKLKVENWLGLSENYLTTYNTTPYQVNDDYNPTHKKYVDEKDSALREKISEIELSKFPNATIFGTPTIQQGQVSNFSLNDYLEFPFLVDFRGRNFEINFEFTTGTDVTNQQNILDSEFGLAFAIRNKHFVLALSYNGTSWATEQIGTLNLESSRTYRVRISWSGLVYRVQYSIDGGKNYIDDIQFGGTSYPYPKQMYIGVGKLAQNYFEGSINLNYSDVIIEGNKIWLGMDDAGLSLRADINLENISSVAEQKIKDIVNPNIPTKTSQLENDSNYLNAIPSDYKTKTENDNLYQPKGTYLTSESDPTVPSHVKSITQNDINNWNSKTSFDGNYNSLSNKPSIPTKVSELQNDSNFISSYTETDPTVPNHVKSITQQNITSWNNKSDFSGSYNDLSDKPNIPIVPTNISSFTNDSGYLTEHQSLKTINNQSIVGTGNITIEGGTAVSPLNGKKIGVMGDSISAHYGTDKGWVEYLAENTGAIVYNVAVTGATVGKVGDSPSILDQLGYFTNPNELDYIVIMCGANDFLGNRKIGNINEWDDESLIGGFKRAFQTISLNVPRVKVMVATDPPIYDSINDKGYEKFINATLEVCNHYHIPCINLWSVFGKSPTIEQERIIYWQDDNLHLTLEGQQHLSNIMKNYIESGINNNNTNAITWNNYKMQVLTQAEYDSLTTKDSNTIYLIKEAEGGIDAELWNKFFKINKYGVNDVTNSNPKISLSGIGTGALIGNMSEENATYSYGTPVSNIAMALENGKTITINYDINCSNINTFNTAYYINGGNFTDMVITGGVNGNYNLTYTNNTGSSININGIAFMLDTPNTNGFTFEMTVKSITIA